jgi:D-sedoheptulose 7-phosphate isomerase
VPFRQKLDLTQIYEDLIKRGQMDAFEVTRRFHEIGSPEGLEETRSYLSSQATPERCFAQKYLSEARQALEQIDTAEIERIAELLVEVRARGGRIFFLGVGGGAGNCSHAVNDFRKLAGIESYAPTDNVSELTARTNDEGWETVFASWLRTSHLRPQDMVFVFSVGGGDLEHNISPNLVRALEYTKRVGASIVGVVGRNGGYTAKVADACVVVPTVNPNTVTPHTESFQAIVWHLLVSHPALQSMPTKWESVR